MIFWWSDQCWGLTIPKVMGKIQKALSKMKVTFVRVSSIEFKKSSIESENSSINSTLYQSNGKLESTSLSHITSLRLDFLQRQWKNRVYLTFSLHFSPTRLFYNGSGKVESTSLSHFTSLRLDFSQWQWKSRVYLTFSLHFSPTRLFTLAVEKSSLPNVLTSLLSDSTFHNGSGKVESTSLSHFTSLRRDFSQRQWKSRVYLTFWKTPILHASASI